MTTATARFRGSVARLQRHFAGPHSTATVRRSGQGLRNPATGAAVLTLAVRGAHNAGVASLNLDAASVQGALGIGWQFQVAGDGTTYEVQAGVNASSNRLDGVTISPALAANAANDAVVTITRAYGEWSYPAMRRQFRQDHVDGEAILLGDWMLIVSLEGAPQTELDLQKDRVVFDNKTLTVVRKLPFAPGLDEAAWRLHCRG